MIFSFPYERAIETIPHVKLLHWDVNGDLNSFLLNTVMKGDKKKKKKKTKPKPTKPKKKKTKKKTNKQFLNEISEHLKHYHILCSKLYNYK